MADTNPLDFLIPTGEYDIAVRELLVKIFGDAIACKVPGMACGSQTIQDGGALTATVFSTFNAGTLIFVTILLIFISMFVFTRTALDGEFMGRSWNTTFSALRLVAGVGFLLPMPNGYSTIQNFAMYVGLWSSGFGNQTTLAVTDHYLKRLQSSMIEREPMAGSVDQQLRDIFNIHLCVKLINTHYAPQGANLTYKHHAPYGDSLTNAYETISYSEQGNFLPKGVEPCGKFVIHQFQNASLRDRSNEDNTWGATFGINPFAGKIKDEMKKTATELSEMVRTAKTNIIKDQLLENSELANLANYAATKFHTGSIKYDENGISSVPTGEIINIEDAKNFLKEYSIIISKNQDKLTKKVEEVKKALEEKTKAQGNDSFLNNARELLTSSGWMGTATTYSTMMDFAALKFSTPTERPYVLSLPSQEELATYSENSANSLIANMHMAQTLFDNILSSDTARSYIEAAKKANGTTADLGATLEQPTITESSLKKIVKSNLSPSDAMGAIYGWSFANGLRNFIVKQMTVSENGDPLMQIKSIGDFVTSAAEFLMVGEIAARTVIAVGGVATNAVTGNIIGKVIGANETGNAAVEGIKYVLEGIFSFIKASTFAMMALGYLFSTWLPATPFIAFLMASLGWLFGFIMLLFALNIWGVMHVTPARNDSFIGSETQGYLLMVSLFFRPAIAVSALSLSYVMAPPIIKMVNLTLLPMMYTTNASTNFFSIILGTLFCLFLYFAVIKGVLVMIYTIPQSFPDEVMRVINAGIGDLGQSKSQGEMGAGAGAAAIAVNTAGRMDDAGNDHFRGTLRRKSEAAAKKAKNESEKNANGQPTPSKDGASAFGGAGGNNQISKEREE